MDLLNKLDDVLGPMKRCFALFESREVVVDQLDAIAKTLGVPATVIGGSALPTYNYNRATEDIDIITSVDDAHKLGDQLMKTGKFEFIGQKKFRHIQTGMIVNFCPEGTQVGKHAFPQREHNEPGLRPASLPLLLITKVKGRAKDRVDVMELIKRNKLTKEWLVEYVLPKLSDFYKKLALQLWDDIQQEMKEENSKLLPFRQ